MTNYNSEPNGGGGVSAQKGSIARRLIRAVALAWRPVALSPPTVDPDLENLPVLERVAETLRFTLLSIESAVSPQGGLRAWLKLNFLVAAVLAIPALLIVPVVTYLLSGFSTWTMFISQIASNLLSTAVSALLIVIVVVVTGHIVMWQLRSARKKGGRGRR